MADREFSLSHRISPSRTIFHLGIIRYCFKKLRFNFYLLEYLLHFLTGASASLQVMDWNGSLRLGIYSRLLSVLLIKLNLSRAAANAFDELVIDADYVIHTASSFHFQIAKPVKDLQVLGSKELTMSWKPRRYLLRRSRRWSLQAALPQSRTPKRALMRDIHTARWIGIF